MKKIGFIIVALVLAIGIGIIGTDNISVATPQKVTASTSSVNYISVTPLQLVENPSKYLNKKVQIKATFDKFSSLGLDYKPAFRNSDAYITFLVKRDNVSNDIPLSEMKNFMKRDLAEKFIDIETGDIIQFDGTVFSNALGDVWVDVTNFKVLTKKNKEVKKI